MNQFACIFGHTVSAWDSARMEPIDLTGHFCPVCMGAVEKDKNDIGPPQLLAPKQSPEPAFKPGDKVRYTGKGPKQWPPIGMQLIGTVRSVNKWVAVEWPDPMRRHRGSYPPSRLTKVE